MTHDPRVLSEQERADLQRIAQAAPSQERWTVKQDDDDWLVVVDDEWLSESGHTPVATIQDDDPPISELLAAHIAAFNPETALRLLARLTEVEGENQALRTALQTRASEWRNQVVTHAHMDATGRARLHRSELCTMEDCADELDELALSPPAPTAGEPT